MKVTKVKKIRIAVSRENKDGTGRGILYPAPNEKYELKTVEEVIKGRVKDANKMYNVFFLSNVPRELENHFCELVKIAENCQDAEEFLTEAIMYSGYEEVDKNGKTIWKKIYKFQYSSAKKNMKKVLDIHVRERMVDDWNAKDYRRAAVNILQCICDKNYKKQIEELRENISDVTLFLEASKMCNSPYIDKNTFMLEQVFTAIMKQLAEYPKKNVSQRIWWLENQLKEVQTKSGKKIVLSEFSYDYATEDRMKAVLVRMRRTLKRGTNGEIAIHLLQGIAQMDGKNLPATIKELCETDSSKKALVKYLKAVHDDYHKTSVVKSIKNHDVKVQVNKDKLDLSCMKEKSAQKIQEDKKIKKEKKIIASTLEDYANSSEKSVETLKIIKGVLLDYFMWNEPQVKDEYISESKLWNIPRRIEEYFDEGFESVDPKKDQKIEAKEDLLEIFNRTNTKNKEIKNRINYVNCGKYQQLVEAELVKAELEKNKPDEVRIYWISYVKDFVESHYVSKKRTLAKEDCYKTQMFYECWKDVLRFICGKYMDIGKAVYHFAMPESITYDNHAEFGVLNDRYQKGITSFDYEAIKAEENIQRDIANATISVAASFSRSVFDYTKHQHAIQEEAKKKKEERKNLEDIFFINPNEDFLNCIKDEESLLKQLLRFYGGYSNIDGLDKSDANKLALELLSHIKEIRNENFHFTGGKKEKLDTVYTNLLWENERKIYVQNIKEKYYFNKVGMFYSQKDIQELVKQLYTNNTISDAQIPAFRTIWQRKLLPEYVKAAIVLPWSIEDPNHVVFEGALYFLLKEIYYRDFIVSEMAKELFVEAVANYKKIAGRKNQNAANDFEKYVNDVKQENMKLGQLCQLINTEYNQQNRDKQEKEIYKHFKMLLSLCMRMAFQKYIEEQYSFIKKPEIQTNSSNNYLDSVKVKCMEMNPERAHWFTFAHFIHPRKLNELVGNFKDYIQYRENVVRRAGYAGESVDKKVFDAESILEVLEFVRSISGRVLGEFTDYYPDEATYEAYMMKYFAKDVDLGKYDIYKDSKNGKILRNVELARMYAGGDVELPGYPVITKEEIEKYYEQKDEIATLQSQGICKNKEDQERIVEFQRLKGRITLNEVTDLFALVNDLLGNLVSLAYLRERDEMYLLLGFYYMALRNPKGWENEILDSVNEGKYQVNKGLVLSQIVSVYDFETNMLAQNGEGNWVEKSGGKGGLIYKLHSDSLNCVMPLFEISKYAPKTREVRNYVDHSKYYVNHQYSILDLYSQFYTNSFGYSSKLRKSVLFNLQSTLEKYFVEAGLKFEGRDQIGLDERKFKSVKFTYKYEDTNPKTKWVSIKNIDIPAKSDVFMNAVWNLLKYKK